jgi:peptide-methionine (S)-S-oxide reductase
MLEIEKIVLGGGCFWCLEAVYQEIPGVMRVVSGYAGGVTDNPNYESVCEGKTGYAEVVLVEFDPKAITLEYILYIFWKIHDPTSLNKQGNDIGTQYRSCIYYTTNQQLQTIENHIKLLEDEDIYSKPIVTQVEQLTQFYPAEPYHQNYYKNNPNQGYCQLVIAPKIQKISELLQKK